MRISVIIPTLDEATAIGQTLNALAKLSGNVEIVVVDGGSSDQTREIVDQCGVKLITSQRGRGKQMHAGACVARGGVFWFVHADTQPPGNAIELIADSLRDPRIVSGSFDVQFDSQRCAARFLTVFYRVLRRLGVCYGDAAIFVRREAYEAAGGFKQFAIFEDLDFVRRVRRQGRFVQLAAPVTTSARRFEGHSFTITFARWTLLQVLYWIGFSPDILKKLYAPVRRAEGDAANVLLQRR